MSTIQKMPVKLTSLLSFIFFFSGFAALIYQVAWQRLLTVHYGVGTISITLIVSVYMFGLGLGALFGGFLSERVKNKITFYFIIELLIGCFGLISLTFLDFLGRYTAGSNYLVSFFYMFLYLSIPTLLMGITLPLLTKIFNSLIKNFLNTVSFLYFINTIGAAAGAVFASYIIISFFGLDTAIYIAVVINFILAVLIYLAKSFHFHEPISEYAPGPQNREEVIMGKIAYLLVMVTGFLAIGYEIVWFRVIGVILKASPYAFSSVLSVYLLGIASGSYSMSKLLKKYKETDKKSLFFSIQFFIGIYVIVVFTGYYYLTKYTPLEVFTRTSFSVYLHPYLTIPSFSSIKGLFRDIYLLTDVFLWPLVFMFVPTVLMGASFPLISMMALSKQNKEGKTVGTVYFFNIVGNVLGGIITGFLLLPFWGTENTLLGFSLIGILFGILISEFIKKKIHLIRRTVYVIVMILISVFVFPKQGQLYETMHIPPGDEYKSYLEEGRDGIVMTYKHKEKVWNYINGLIHGARPAYMYNYMTLEAASFSKKIENILIIGYGTGSIAEIILKMEDIQRVTIVELNDALIKNLKKMDLFRKMLSDSRLELVIDDGRRFLLRTNKKYDLILIDPIRSAMSYSNNLYSHQFYQLVKQHLNPGGVFMVWMDEYRVMPKTVMSVFDHVRAYNIFCLASDMPLKRDDYSQQKLFDNFSPEEQAGILRWTKKESEYVGDTDYLNNLVAEYDINQDWEPLTEYYFGLKVKEKLFLDK